MLNKVPNLTLLNQFIVTAQDASISKAALRLRISQPALSKNIRKLEATLGTQLFDRHAGGASLTEAGRILLDHALTINLEYQFALENIRNVLSKQASTIRIGAGPIWSSTVLPIVVEKFHTIFPHHRIQVKTGSIIELNEELRLGQINILAGALLQNGTAPGFVTHPLARSEMVVFASEDHPLVKDGAVQDPRKLSDQPFVVFMESRNIAEQLTSYLKQFQADPPRYMLETTSLFTCTELVRTGKYLLFETKMLGQKPIGRGMTAVRLPKPIHLFDVGLSHREGLDRVPHLNRLIKIMTQSLAETAAQDSDPAPAGPGAASGDGIERL